LSWTFTPHFPQVNVHDDEFAISALGARNTAGGFGAGVARVTEEIARRLARRTEMSLPVRIMAAKAGQPRWTMEEAE
jgi:hypothetical protein